MKFKLANYYIEVKDFYLSNLGFVIIKKNKENDQYLLELDGKLLLNFKFVSLTKIDNYIVVSDEENNIFIFNDKILLKKIQGYSLSENPLSNHEIIISKRISKGIYDKFKYNLDCDIIEKISNTPYLKLKNYLYNINYEQKYISLFTGEYEWQTDLSKCGEIRKILGVAGSVLWLTLYRAGKSKDKEIILALDVNSGELQYKLPEDLPISDVHIKLIEEKQTIISFKSGISTSFIDTYFVEIDAITGKVVRNETIKAFEKENLKGGSWQFFEDNIYFKANKDFLNSTHIGILDYTTLDLLWFEEVKDRKAGLRDIQVTQDKIYVLDQGNQLHIYEKE